MNASPYFGTPAAMQTPDYQTFLALLQQMQQRKQGGAQSKDKSTGGSPDMAKLLQMFAGMGGQQSLTPNQLSAFNTGAGPVSPAGANSVMNMGNGSMLSMLGLL